MCGRFALNDKVDAMTQLHLEMGGDFRDWVPSWNFAPTQTIAVVLADSREGTVSARLEPARWSLVPPWSKELKLKYPTFNARCEGITEKSTWSGPVKSQRALVPATGYYEWQTAPSASGKPQKQPKFIRPADGSLAVFAGLYSWWADPAKPKNDDSRWMLTATILTMPSVPSLARIHDRNPVTLPSDWWDEWLSPSIEGDQAFVDAAVAASVPVAESLEFYDVGPVNGDGPELIARLTT